MWRTLTAGLLGCLIAFAAPAAEWFDLAEYRDLKQRDQRLLERVLGAMYESVFYAQESIGQATVCASPLPVPGAQLVALVDWELAHPTHPQRKSYSDNDHVAFVLVNALKSEGACK